MVLKEPCFGTLLDPMVLKEVDLGPFLALLMDGPERTLLPVIWSLVLKESSFLALFAMVLKEVDKWS